MTVAFLDPGKIEPLRQSINRDPEFKMAARYMSEDILLEVESARCIVRVRNGAVHEIKLGPSPGEAWSFGITASIGSWEQLLQPEPPPFFTGLNAAMIRGNLQITGNLELAFAYLWVMNRMLDIMRQPENK
jgi:hypothetical protein